MTTLPAQLGPYAIDRELGRGGMGVVYLGHDPKLDRPVAIKALPEHLAGDPDRLARFQREAKLLASLTHPNIAGVYGLEDHDGAHYLVMEYVEGDTLASLLQAGPLDVEEALRISAQVASGVEAAHEEGVIHRDLKPGNIVVTRQGKAKVLDFGLAKEIEGRGSSLDLSNSPTAATIRAPQTVAGQVMGTAAYLSPEQARGKQLDKRTDIWSFGCLLNECLTGITPFAGETASDSIAAVLEREPNWKALPANTPPLVRDLLKRCLEKDADRRLRDIGDARIVLEEALANRLWTTTAMAAATGEIRRRNAWRGVGIAFGLLVLGVAIGLGVVGLTPLGGFGDGASPGPTRLSIVLPPKPELGNWIISPDGRTVVFGTQEYVDPAGRKTEARLHIRRLGSFDSRVIDGSERGYPTSFSPDGRSILFFTSHENDELRDLKRVAADAGPPVTLRRNLDSESSANWLSNDEVIFTEDRKSVYRMSANGGEPTLIMSMQESELDYAFFGFHRPEGAEWMLTTVASAEGSVSTRIEAISLVTGEHKVLLNNAAWPSDGPDGHVIFARSNTLFAVGFDGESGDLVGAPVPVFSGLHTEVESIPAGRWSVSQAGNLVFQTQSGQRDNRTLASVDLQGRVTPLSTIERPFQGGLEMSPDGRWLLIEMFGESSFGELWLYGLETGELRVVGRGEIFAGVAVWAPDSKRFLYVDFELEKFTIMQSSVDGSVPAGEILVVETEDGFISGISPDGSLLAFSRDAGPDEEKDDIYLVSLDGGEPQPLISTSADEWNLHFAPGNDWVSYNSDESGKVEIYLQSYTPEQGLGSVRRRVSTDGGLGHWWSPDGQTLFYTDPRRYVMSVSITTDPSLVVSEPTELFNWETIRSESLELDPTTGDRFVFIQKAADEQPQTNLSVVLNWFDEVRDKIESSGRR